MYLILLYCSFLLITTNNSISSFNFFIKKSYNTINTIQQQCIILSKKNKILCNYEAIKFIEDITIVNKNIITIAPGGFKGLYLLGTLTYIKETYNTTNFIYSGASAGSWNCLFMCYKGNSWEFVFKLLQSIHNTKSIVELEYLIKCFLLSTYTDTDFDFQKIFIGVTTIKQFKPYINIFSDFKNLEDAINCCLASSHIPFITGGIIHKYYNMFSFDGGFSYYPYLNKSPILHISSNMWYNYENTKINKFKEFINTFYNYKMSCVELFYNGYRDAKYNKPYLDSVFLN
jgi:hypothetical protein